MFEIENLKFKDILNIEALVIEQTVTCITGPSGCGKTTLLKMLNHMNVPDSGKILYHGKDIAQMDAVELRRKVVMMGQNSVIYPGDIRDNLLIGISFSKKKEPTDDILVNCLRQVGLNKSLADTCAVLSGGEKQRLCLARVILMDADTYLLDEPSSALDKETEQFLVSHLAEFVRVSGKQMIMVTHSENAVSICSPDIVKMERGMVRGRGKETNG